MAAGNIVNERADFLLGVDVQQAQTGERAKAAKYQDIQVVIVGGLKNNRRFSGGDSSRRKYRDISTIINNNKPGTMSWTC